MCTRAASLTAANARRSSGGFDGGRAPPEHSPIHNQLRVRSYGAEGELRQELARNPRHGMAQFRLGQVLMAREQEAAAVEPLELAAKALPGQAEIRRELGKAYRKTGRLAEARRTWEAIAAARPGDDQVHFLLGTLYREMGEPALSQASLARHRDVLAQRRALTEKR